MTTNETTATTSVSVPTVTGIRAVRLLMQLAGPSVVAGAIARRHSTLPLLEKCKPMLRLHDSYRDFARNSGLAPCCSIYRVAES